MARSDTYKKIRYVCKLAEYQQNEYLSAIKRSVVNNLELKILLKENLTKDILDRDVFFNGINQSYKYE